MFIVYCVYCLFAFIAKTGAKIVKISEIKYFYVQFIYDNLKKCSHIQS